MKAITARRITQVFFVLLLLWLAVVSTVGQNWWQWRNWPVNWLLQLDPLVALGTVLAAGALYAGLIWALATVVLTIVLGRFFCGWVCPFGAIHQFVGYLHKRFRTPPQRIGLNRYRPAQSLKYYILVFMLGTAFGGLTGRVITGVAITGGRRQAAVYALLAAACAAVIVLAICAVARSGRRATVAAIATGILAIALQSAFTGGAGLASLQTGLLDPIPLAYRSISIALLPLADKATRSLLPLGKYYEQAWPIGGIFMAAVLANLIFPRFFCRFVCPLGAMLGLLSRWSVWRIGKKLPHCSGCKACELDCEGACEPSDKIRISECVLCLNCVGACPTCTRGYSIHKSLAGELTAPDLGRRGLLASLAGGLAVIPLVRLGGQMGANFNPAIIRPPGAMEEDQFLRRCIKCGQCMRVCPTNVIQPAGPANGLEQIWTPQLNNRVGTSGCQLHCVACSQICPTGALRPISLDEKLGQGQYAQAGPVKLGTAFVDRGRCLPWSMDTPCIVCQENCPVSPKAIFTRETFSTIRAGMARVESVGGATIKLIGATLTAEKLAGGDYWCQAGPERQMIVDNTADSLTVAQPWRQPPQPGSYVEIQVRLQLPQVDPKLCVGCGICEHECPVKGRRAIKVSPEGETRSSQRSLLI